MNESAKTAIGSGAYFPINLTTVDGRTTWEPLVGDIRLINQNLMAILSTQIGQIIRNEDFGTRVWECMEEPNTQALQFLVRRFLKDSISSWEPRIRFLESILIRNKEQLDITLRYQVIMDQKVSELNFSYNPQTNKLNII